MPASEQFTPATQLDTDLASFFFFYKYLYTAIPILQFHLFANSNICSSFLEIKTMWLIFCVLDKCRY